MTPEPVRIAAVGDISVLINKLSSVAGITDENNRHMRAEMYIKALCYFEVLNYETDSICQVSSFLLGFIQGWTDCKTDFQNKAQLIGLVDKDRE